jgi:hypothetical protein
MLDFIGFLSDFLMGSNPVISSKTEIQQTSHYYGKWLICWIFCVAFI